MAQKSILIIDDEFLHLEDLEQSLSRSFPTFRIVGTCDPTEALKLVKAERFDLIITDMRFGDERHAGYELLLVSKRKNPSAQIIVYTGFATIDLAVRCIRAGCYDLIQKGANKDGLIRSAHQAVEIASSIIDRDSLAERLILADWNAIGEAHTNQDKGYALESLMSSLFRSIPGWQRIESRVTTKTEEVDLVVVNESTAEFWRRYPSFILVECKYWTTDRVPGRNEFDAFYQKICRRGPDDCRLGFFVSMNGVASTFETELDRIAKEATTIVTFSRDDVWDMICSENRNEFLIQKISNRLFA